MFRASEGSKIAIRILESQIPFWNSGMWYYLNCWISQLRNFEMRKKGDMNKKTSQWSHFLFLIYSIIKYNFQKISLPFANFSECSGILQHLGIIIGLSQSKCEFYVLKLSEFWKITESYGFGVLDWVLTSNDSKFTYR